MSSEFKQRVVSLFEKIKQERFDEYTPSEVPIYNKDGKLFGYLRPVTKKALQNNREIDLLTRWRNENVFAFPSQFKATTKGTESWLKSQLIQNPTRILFFIDSAETKRRAIGHIGLYSFNFKYNTCEIDNVVRGDKKILKGAMTMALKALIHWTNTELKPKSIFLRVFSDNKKAIGFYKRCRFVPLELIPMAKKIVKSDTFWREDKSLKKAEKYFLRMTLKI